MFLNKANYSYQELKIRTQSSYLYVKWTLGIYNDCWCCICTNYFSTEYSKKEKEILDTLSSNDVDIERLRSFAVSPGGLLNDDIRKEVWPRLLDVDVTDIPKKPRKWYIM